MWGLGLPRWLSGEWSSCQCRRCKKLGFGPGLRKISWRRAWQHTPAFSSGESHGQRSLVGYSHEITKNQTRLSMYQCGILVPRPGVQPMSPALKVQFSRSVMSDSLRPHGLQHARPPCSSPTPGACSNSCPSSQWCHPTISSSVVPFSCLRSFPASSSFPMSQFFASGGQNIGVSASASVLPMHIQDWFPLGWTGWISLQSKGLSRVLQIHSSKASILQHSAFFMVQLSHPYMTTGKTIALTRQTFVGKVMCLVFNMLSRLVIAFLPRSKHLLISWLQSPTSVILQPRKRKSVTVGIVSPSFCHEVLRPDAMIFVLWMLSFKPVFSTLLFHFHQEAL